MWGRLRRGLRGCPHSGLFALRRVGCLHAALVFPCIVIGPVRVSFGCLPMALAFPCILIGLLASPLCGAAPTFFAAAKKAGCNRQPVVSHLGHPAETAQDEMCPRATYLSDKALIRSSVALRAPLLGITPCVCRRCEPWPRSPHRDSPCTHRRANPIPFCADASAPISPLRIPLCTHTPSSHIPCAQTPANLGAHIAAYAAQRDWLSPSCARFNARAGQAVWDQVQLKTKPDESCAETSPSWWT